MTGQWFPKQRLQLSDTDIGMYPGGAVGFGPPVTIWSDVLGSSEGGLSNWSVRQIAATITGTGPWTQIRVTVESAPTAGALNIDNASVGIQSSGASTTATPVEFLFGGGSGTSAAVGSNTVTSDWLDFAFTHTDNLIVTVDLGNPSSTTWVTSGGDGYYARSSYNSYNISVPSGMTFFSGRTSTAQKLEARAEL